MEEKLKKQGAQPGDQVKICDRLFDFLWFCNYNIKKLYFLPHKKY
jgi:hypothetical protein